MNFCELLLLLLPLLPLLFFDHVSKQNGTTSFFWSSRKEVGRASVAIGARTLFCLFFFQSSHPAIVAVVRRLKRPMLEVQRRVEEDGVHSGSGQRVLHQD